MLWGNATQDFGNVRKYSMDNVTISNSNYDILVIFSKTTCFF